MTQDNQHEADNPVVIAQEDSIKADYIPTNNQPSTGIMVTSTSMETPFLPPQFLNEYEKIVPGSAKEIFDMIVKQQEFNMNIKNQEMDLNRQNLERIKVIDNANIKEQEASALVREKGNTDKISWSNFCFNNGISITCSSLLLCMAWTFEASRFNHWYYRGCNDNIISTTKT